MNYLLLLISFFIISQIATFVKPEEYFRKAKKAVATEIADLVLRILDFYPDLFRC